MAKRTLGNPQFWGGWAIFESDIGNQCIPKNDIKPDHTLSMECPCEPYVGEEGQVLHNANDGREEYEEGRRKPH